MVEINITDNNDDEVVVAWPEPERPAPIDATPLFELKSRRDKIANELVKSFQVPRWESPEVFCEIAIIEPSVLAKAIQKREKQKKTRDDWVAWAYCDVLAPSVKRVYATVDTIPDTEFSLRKDDPTGPATRVDHDLSLIHI